MKRITLRRRLFVVVAAAVLPLAIMSAVALYASYQEQREQMARTGIDIARAISTAVDAELRRTMSILGTLGNSTALGSGDLRAFHGRAQGERAAHKNWVAVLLSDPSGRVLLDSETPFGQAPPAIADLESHELAVRKAAPQVGYLARDPRGNWTFPVRVPIVRDGKVAFVVTAVLQPDVILAMLVRQGVPEDWVVAVADAKGLRVARTRSPDSSLGTPFSPTLVEEMKRVGPEGASVTHTSEGIKVFTAWTQAPETGWRTAVGASVQFVEANARRSIYTLGLGILASVVVGFLSAMYLARRILEPMDNLREGADAVSRGESFDAAASSIVEIDDVARALSAAARHQAVSRADREVLLVREREARALAETASRAKDEFLAMLGHELRNPLAAISNATTLLENPRLPHGEQERMRSIIARQVAHLSRLMDDLLDVGRVLTGKIVLRAQPLDLASLVGHAVASLRASGRLEAHAVVQDLHPAWMQADAVRIDQIVTNLVVNAVKYTPAHGHIRVTVIREGDEAVLRVKDDGVGMPPELAARVFDLFVQGERELDRSEGGLGIGLTLVRRLAELHRGSATAHSDGPGKGSEFVVRFPAIDPPAAQPGGAS